MRIPYSFSRKRFCLLVIVAVVSIALFCLSAISLHSIKYPTTAESVLLTVRERQILRSLFSDTSQLNNSISSGQVQTLAGGVVDTNISSRYLLSDFTLCEKHQPHLLIWVYSSLNNHKRRKSVRATWGNTTQYAPMRVVVVFSLATTKHDNSYMHHSLRREQGLYGDLVQDGTFVDAYRNLSMKAESMLQWTNAFCSGVKLLLKTDDDSFLIPKRVAGWLRDFDINDRWPSKSILGNVFKSPSPYRNTNSKWYISYDEWPHDIWAERACSGSGYFISGDSVSLLNNLIGKVPYVWLEDMYITGILAERAGLSHISNSQYHHLIYRPNKTRTAVRNSRSVFIVGNIPSVKETYSFWKLVGHMTPGYNIRWPYCIYSCSDS